MNFIKTINNKNEIISYNSNNGFYHIFNKLELTIRNEKIENLRFDLISDHNYFGIEFDINENHIICALNIDFEDHTKLINKLIKTFNF